MALVVCGGGGDAHMPAGVTGVTLEHRLRVVIASAVDAAVVVLLITGAARHRSGHRKLDKLLQHFRGNRQDTPSAFPVLTRPRVSNTA